MSRLENKVAIITGGASGMGKAMSELFAKEGAKVLVADFNEAGAKEVSDTLNEVGLEAISTKVDVSSREDVEAMFDKAVEVFGTVDILVNNAGIIDGFEPVGEISDEKWDRVFNVNTKGTMYGMRKAVDYWLENDKKGNIINTISTGGLNGGHSGAAYTASKHAVVGLTKNTAFMYAQKGIRANGIAPGAVATNISGSAHGISEFGVNRTKLTQSLISQLGQPEDIANVALFLASDESQFVNGTVYVADGAWTAGF